MMKTMRASTAAIEPYLSRGLEQAVCAKDVRVDERVGSAYRSVYMAFGSKVNERCDIAFAQQLLDQIGIAYVAYDQFGLFDVSNGRPISGVGKAIQDDDRIVRVHLAPVMDEIAADKSGTSGDKQVRQGIFPL
jgi:hypothetical protein